MHTNLPHPVFLTIKGLNPDTGSSNFGLKEARGIMIIKRVQVQNFRSIKDATLECDRLTVLVGPNGAGKSSFLKALELFYTPNATYGEEDFYNRDTNNPIIIRVTFTELSEEEEGLYRAYLDGNELTVEKQLSWPPARTSQKYYGSRLVHPDFQTVRMAERVTEKRRAYQELLASGRFPGLRNLTGNASRDEIEAALDEWEQNHPQDLRRTRDNGQFFGFKEVGEAKLERYTRFLYIPAVRDASQEASEGRGTVISELMDIVVRNALARREDLQKMWTEMYQKYREMVDPEKIEELRTLQARLTETLSTFAPGTEVLLSWQRQSDEVSPPMPKAEVRIIEDGFPTAVERVGHGVQRAFILTTFQHLEAARQYRTYESQSDVDLADGVILPSLLIGLEEPEVYQHPSRQRHLANALLRLSIGQIPGVARNTQILYTTHSPLFVDLERFDQVRIVRKITYESGYPRVTQVVQATMEAVTTKLERIEDLPRGAFSPQSTRARLRSLVTPWTSEGFFSDLVVLVEGEQDRAAIVGVAHAMGHDFDSTGIAVIPCMGKSNLHKLATIFKAFHIPVYVVWDSDEGTEKNKDEKQENIKRNHCLLRLVGEELEDYPATVKDTFACFKVNLNKTLEEELKPQFRTLLDAIKEELGYTKDAHALKSPETVGRLIEAAQEKGLKSPTLETIVSKIVQLRSRTVADML